MCCNRKIISSHIRAEHPHLHRSRGRPTALQQKPIPRIRCARVGSASYFSHRFTTMMHGSRSPFSWVRPNFMLRHQNLPVICFDSSLNVHISVPYPSDIELFYSLPPRYSFRSMKKFSGSKDFFSITMDPRKCKSLQDPLGKRRYFHRCLSLGYADLLTNTGG